jgi:N4-(beta-N-acetylglucosaminyl)-L-asparaginase
MPLLLATWTFGLPAASAAWSSLAAGGSALDAVESACRYAEADLSNHTVGVGGLPDRDGHVSLDAAVMLSPARRGGVCAVRSVAHLITLARRVMERTPHVLLAGEGADQFARELGIGAAELLTAESAKLWQDWRAQHPRGAVEGQPFANFEESRPAAAAAARDPNKHHDTIGVLALDAGGTLAAGCSTSGLPWKLPGRVGDSPIIGHALYCDPAAGAAVCTGHGELVSSVCAAFLAVETLRRGAPPRDAATEPLTRIRRSYAGQLTDRDQVAIIVLTPAGDFTSASLRPGFKLAVRSEEQNELIEPEVIVG